MQSSPPLRRRAWLCLPPLVFLTLDVAITLAHQPAEYWQGRPETLIEANSIVRIVMLHGPTAAIAGALVYALIFSLALLFWRSPLVFVLAFLLTLGHAVGAGSWLLFRHGIGGGALAVVVLAGGNWLLGYSWRRASRPD